MISTLIRGSNSILPSTQKYREEYLVDTETNEIIYPKVLPTSITNIPNSSTNNNTSTILGGIDANSYIHKKVSLSGMPVNMANNFVIYEQVNSPAVYYVEFSICPQGSTLLNSYNREISFNMVSDVDDVGARKYKYATGVYTVLKHSTIIPINKEVRNILFTSSSNVTYKLNKDAYYIYIAIKLCDLPDKYKAEIE